MSSGHKYTISDENIAEDQEILLGNGRRWKTGEWLRKSYGAHHILIAAMGGALSTAIVLLLALFLWSNADKLPTTRKSFTPDFPYDYPRTFQPDHAYSANGSNWAEPWYRLQPPGHGIVRIKNPHQYGLGGAVFIGPNEGSYAISMFHQLHCLETLKSDRKASIAGSQLVDIEHSDHCFDYLRQVIMCHGDMTLEATFLQEDKGEETLIVDGWGTVHMCRNWELMVDFANEHDDKIGEVDPHKHGGGGSHGNQYGHSNNVAYLR